MRLVTSVLLTLTLTATACGTADSTPTPTPMPSATPTPTPSATPTPTPAPLIPGCVRGSIEDDFGSAGQLSGPGVDPATGQLRPPPPGTAYVFSATYLALQGTPAAQQAFGELIGPISAQLGQEPGLVALELGTSMSCGSARTVSVWASEDAMYDFVTSAAHLEAVRRVGEVSRGESVVTHWTSNATASATWAEAARRLEADDGPRY